MNEQHVAGSTCLPPRSGPRQESRVGKRDGQEEQALLRNDPDPIATGLCKSSCVPFVARKSQCQMYPRGAEG